MSSSDDFSKRERQKARRQAKLQQQAVLDKKARRNRLLTFALLGVILLGLVGLAVQRNIAAKNAEKAEKAEATAKLDELGCTPDEAQEDAGQGHLDGTTLGENPPDSLYPERPASSGQHFNNWLMTGVYDQLLDERALVHNLEHGYVVGYYDEGADEAQLTEFREHLQAQIDGDYPKIIAAPWDGDLPGEANFAYLAWNQRQMCADFDTQVFDVFVKAHHSSAGEAPEKGLAPHLEEGGGTLDPGDEPVLLPPLGTQATPSEGMSDPTATEASEGTS